MPASKPYRPRATISTLAAKAATHRKIAGAPPDHLDGHRPDFTFEFQRRRTCITQTMMVQALRARYARVGRAFTISQFDAWRNKPCGGIAIQRRFGSWRTALKTAGIQGAKGQNYTPEELIENLEAAWRSLGRRPGAKTFRQHGTISDGPYRRHWGSLKNACLKFSQYKRGIITRATLLRGSPKPRPQLPPGLRWQLLKAANHRCAACGKSSRDRGTKLEIDHITPLSRGGSNHPKNLRVLCFHCNRGKGAS